MADHRRGHGHAGAAVPGGGAIEFKGVGWCVLTDEGLRAVSSLPALTSLNLSRCRAVSAAGVQAVCNTTATLV